MPISDATTRGVRVHVESTHVPERSRPAQSQWFFAYTVTIENGGAETVQLIGRHWVITDGDGDVQEVRGPGVIGKQPILEPGESFQYTSFCPLTTPFGTMHGTYQMVTHAGGRFEATIAPFALGEAHSIN
jgi:ApaG protein